MNDKHYKIVAIAQVNNELRKGNLERFFKYITPHVDALVVYDDASTDGSYEYACTRTPYTIRGIKNSFTNEWQIKQKLVEKALTLQPDFILLIDADEVVTDTNGEKLQELAKWVIEKNLEGAYIHDINLWRSSTWKRVDSDYDSAYFPRFWRVGDSGLSYTNRKEGLHQSPAPDQIKNLKSQEIVSFLHYGFATEKSILTKYITYASHGQKGENLARFINEERFLKTKKVDKELYPEGLWLEESEPLPLSGIQWYGLIKKYKESINRPSVSIVCLIYQSTEWLQFVYDQVLKYTDLSDKEFFFVANDATPEVKKYLRDNYIPHYIFDNTEEHKNEWYINNVYRAYNYGATMAKGDFIMFINSDMAFSTHWIENAFAHYDTKSCVASRLVESGNLPTGGLCIEKNFGRHLSEYKEREFTTYAKEISKNETYLDGAYMPLFIKKEDFEKIGGYPEGNMQVGSDIFLPTLAKKGEPLVSGDIVLMRKLATIGIIHKTAFDSIVYHFQEGEKRDTPTSAASPTEAKIILINNSLHGKMGERVLWDFMLEGLPSIVGIDQAIVGADEINFQEKAKDYIHKNYPHAEIIIQNASFIDSIDPSLYTIAFLQDDLRRMNRISPQQEETLALANGYVANSDYTAASYPEYHFNVLPIGVDTDLFTIGDQKTLRKKHGFETSQRIGIFVGDLSEVKGWSEIKNLIKKNPSIHWIIVTKGREHFESDNVSLYKQVSQVLLAELYQSADFFIIGSKVETLCLAAMEACSSNTPVIMRKIGVFADFSQKELDACGIFGDDFEDALRKISTRVFSPREVMLTRGLTIENTVNVWWDLIASAKLTGAVRRTYTAPKYTTRSLLRRKMKMVFNKTFIIVITRRYLSPTLYTTLLNLWRTGKKTSKSILGYTKKH